MNINQNTESTTNVMTTTATAATATAVGVAAFNEQEPNELCALGLNGRTYVIVAKNAMSRATDVFEPLY